MFIPEVMKLHMNHSLNSVISPKLAMMKKAQSSGSNIEQIWASQGHLTVGYSSYCRIGTEGLGSRRGRPIPFSPKYSLNIHCMYATRFLGVDATQAQ